MMKKIKNTILIILIVLCSSCNKTNSKDFCDYLINNTNTYIEVKENNYETIEFPEKYDLRDLGLVTPVKNQNPWNTCWGFSTVAASETSILNDLKTTYEDTLLDLSELQLAFFSNSYINDITNAQNGEGTYIVGYDNPLSCGNSVYTATSILSSGIGLSMEETIPYHGKNKIIDNRYSYSKDDDWIVDDSKRFLQGFELIESNILPSPVIRDEKNHYYEYNEYGTQCIKNELMNGRAVSICFHADTFLPNSVSEAKYINTNDNKWTHYTYDDAPYNHSVTIVGWDDTIKKEDFLDHSLDSIDKKQHYPEKDGAWIVKNSWGAETEEFPNYGLWGIKDENDKATGYFYLSYYDHSLFEPESFRFSTYNEDNTYIIDQHDYLQSNSLEGWYDQDIIKMANVFSCASAKQIRAVSCETISENTNVNIQIYKLKNSFNNPEDGNLVYNKDVNYRYAGYHRQDIDTIISLESGDCYSIIITEKFIIDDKEYYGIFVDKQLSKLGAQEKTNKNEYTYGVGIINEKESFVYINKLKEWCDFSKITNEIYKLDGFDRVTFDNFSIKSYSDYLNN